MLTRAKQTGAAPLLLVALALGAWLGPLGERPKLHMDTARDWLFARDCVDGLGCHFAGAPSSFGGLAQGALWIRVVEVALRFHLGALGLEAIVIALHALAAAVLFRLVRSIVSPMGALLAVALYALLNPIAVGYPILWNPSITPLPLALFFLLLTLSMERLSIKLAVAAAVALGLAIDAHLVCVALVPPALVLLARGPARAPGGYLAVLIALAAPLAIDSRDALLSDGQRVFAAGGWAAIAAAAVLLIGAPIAAAWHRQSGRPDPSAKQILMVLSSGCAALIVAGGLVAGKALSARYFVAVVPGLAILSVVALERLSSRAASYVFMAGLVLFAVAARALPAIESTYCQTPREWTLRDAEHIAGLLSTRNFTVDDALRQISASDGRALSSMLSALLPAPTGHTSNSEPVTIVKLGRGAARASLSIGWETVALDGDDVAAVRFGRSLLRHKTISLGRPIVFPSLRLASPRAYSALAYPSIESSPGPHVRAYSVEVVSEGEPQRIAVLRDGGGQRSPWSVYGLSGMPYNSASGGDGITIEPPSVGSHAILTLVRDASRGDDDALSEWPPALLDAPPTATAIWSAVASPPSWCGR